MAGFTSAVYCNTCVSMTAFVEKQNTLPNEAGLETNNNTNNLNICNDCIECTTTCCSVDAVRCYFVKKQFTLKFSFIHHHFKPIFEIKLDTKYFLSHNHTVR